MPNQRFQIPVEGLSDLDPVAIPDGQTPNLRNLRGDENRLVKGPGGITFADEPTPASGFGIRTGTLTIPASTGNQVVTHNLGATPNALIIWGTATDSSSGVDDYRWGIGFTDGTDERAVSGKAENITSGNSNTCRRRAISAIVSFVDSGAGADFAVASFVSWTSTQFTINWTDVTGAGATLNYMIIGAGGVSGKVLTWQTGTSTGNVAVTGAGFQPVYAMHLMAGPGTGAASADDLSWCVGMMDASNQAALHNFSPDNASTGNARRWARNDQCLLEVSGTLTPSVKASFVSLDSDGFTVNIDTAPAADHDVYTLLLAGVSSKIGDFDGTNISAPVIQQVPVGGFTPKAVMIFGHAVPAHADDRNRALFHFGAATATQESVAFGQGTSILSNSRFQVSDSLIYVRIEGAASDIDEAELGSFSTLGFTLNWTTTSARIEPNYLFSALSIATTDLGTPRNIVQAQYSGTTEKTLMLSNKTTFEFDGTDFQTSSETYAGMLAAQRFMVANTQDIIAYSARGLTVSGAQTIRSYDGTTYTNLITSGTNHSANIILAFNDRIISGDVNVGGTVNTQQIRWSVSGDATDWNGLGSGTLEIIETSNAPLTGGFVLGERCFLTKRREIIELIATGTLSPVHRQETVISGVGLVGRHSVGFGEGWVIFLGPDSVYMFDGRNIRDVGRQSKSIMRQIVPAVDYANPDEIQGHVLAAKGEYHLRVGQDVFVYDYIRDRWFRDKQSDIAAFGVLRVGSEITTDVNASEFLLFADTSLLTWRSTQDVTTFRDTAFDSFFETRDFTAQEVIFFRTGSQVIGTLRRLNTAWSVAFITDPNAQYEVGYSTDQGASWNVQTVQADPNGVLVRYFEAPFHKIRFRVRRNDTGTFNIHGFADYEWTDVGQVLPPDLPST